MGCRTRKVCGARSIYPDSEPISAEEKAIQLPNGQVIPTIFPGVLGEGGAKKLSQQQVRFFMPRIGIAFRPTDKTVIRMGAGWFDNIQHLNTFTIFNLMPPKAGSQAYQTSYVAGANRAGECREWTNGQFRRSGTLPTSPVLTLNDPFLTSTGGASVVRPIDVVYLPPDYKDGDVWKWSFDFNANCHGTSSPELDTPDRRLRTSATRSSIGTIL